MENYVKNKEISDKLDEERRKKILKDKEHEMKRILDIQSKEKDEKIKLKLYENVTEAKFIRKDVEDFNSVENKKKKEFDDYIKANNTELVQQISDKK